MNFLEEAKKEEAILLEKLAIVKNVIAYWGNGQNFSTNESISGLVFPSKSSKEKQIIWLFENKISHAIKLKSVQDLYNEHVGNDKTNIDNLVRRLKKESKLSFVKYNGKNILSFWGLPSWIEGNDFKVDYKPDPESLPEIISSEVIIGE